MKVCPRCKEEKPLDEFPPHSGRPDKKYAYCLPCKREYGREQQARYIRTPAGQEKNLRRALALAGATREWWDQQMAACDGRCMICGEEPKGYPRLSVDHNHATGEPRGLLCKDCNNALGLLGDNPATVARALAYLQERGHYSNLDRDHLTSDAIKIAQEVAR